MKAPRGLAALAIALGVLASGVAHAQSRGGTGTGESNNETPPFPLPGFESEPTLPGVLAGAVDPDQYIVGPGDLFLFNFSGRVTRTATLAVGPEGTLFLPGAGSVKVDGMTLSAARREMVRRAAQEYRGVSLDVRLARARTLRVFVAGEAREPGPVNVTASSRLSEILSDSLLTQRASHRNILVTRNQLIEAGSRKIMDEAQVVADLERFNRTGDATFNPFVRDGDLIFIPVATRFVSIEGAVARPGRLELGPADSLHTLIDLAGGPLPAAQRQRCLLVRWLGPTRTDSVFFDLPDSGAYALDPPLQDGDKVFVYFQPRYHELERAAIYGEVRRPGWYPLQTNQTRLSQLVSSAGGFLDRADLSTIRVFRANAAAADGDPELERLSRLSRSEMTASEYEVLRTRLAARREDYRVDWFRLKENPSLDILLRDGDVVRVDPILSTVRVDGEVRRPGLVEYRPGRSVSEYVHLAGGFSRRAAAGKVRVTRAITGQTLFARDVPEIAPGDLIWVPERPDISTWQHLQTLIMVAGQVAAVIIAVRR